MFLVFFVIEKKERKKRYYAKQLKTIFLFNKLVNKDQSTLEIISTELIKFGDQNTMEIYS
jgi:hypothetical protein